MTGQGHFWLGARRAVPLAVGAIPFGLVVGATAVSVGLDTFAASAMSVLVFAGAAQLSALELLRADAPAVVIVATAAVINLRMVMYSAALAPHLCESPRRSRGLAAYVLTDQSFALSVLRYGEPDGERHKLAFFVGACIPLWLVWQASTVAGALVGSEVPPALSLDFAVPLMFLAMAAPAIRTRHAGVACGVAVAVVLLAGSAPYGLGLILAAVAGVVAGTVSEGRAS